MGNCLCLRQPAAWAVDDEEAEHWIENEEDEDLTSRQQKESSASSTEVRIRISKKQLEELLRRAEAKDLPTRDVLNDLINMSMAEANNHWRPVLKSIEEERDD